MIPKDCRRALELLRDFAGKVVAPETYLKNLVFEGIETPNKRLWALRKFLQIDEKTFAKKLDLDYNQYHEYEKNGTPVPAQVLQKVSLVFNVSLDWLLCRIPMYSFSQK